jgi:asparagine synthase (glutamine-hydrolysing)
MCGIAGVLTTSYRTGTLEALNAAAARLRHRGPDDDGVLTFPERPVAAQPFVALASRRLAILDLSAAGHQPMVTRDGRYALVLNGEIYNHVELRAELEARGHAFRSHCDAEVLLEGFAAWGRAVLDRVVGMFAFAIYDTREQRLFLARDPFGIKPLYYAHAAGGLAFASEIRALLELPGVSRRVNPQRFFDFLDHGDTDESSATLFADVQQLQAAHYLEVTQGAPHTAHPVRYWRADLSGETDLSFEQAAERLRELFLQSVAFHLRSDVPLGFALSGGLDSSSIMAVTRHLLGPTADLQAFTYFADDPNMTEGEYPGVAAQAAGGALHPVTVTAREIADGYPALQRLQGEPIAGPTIFAQHQVCGVARAHGIKVILEGHGSDEMLAGYDYFVPAQTASLIRRGRWGEALRRPDVSSREVWRYVIPQWARRARARLRSNDTWRTRAVDWQWFRPRGVRRAAPWAPRNGYAMREYLHHTLVNNPLQALLRFVDRNAMGFSMENRVPFLTRPLVEFVFSLPESYLVAPDGSKKAVFRRAMRGLVSDTILDRRNKIGFATPNAAWLIALAPWVEEHLDTVRGLPGIDGDAIVARWRLARAERRNPDAWAVWRWVSLAIWAEQNSVQFD